MRYVNVVSIRPGDCLVESQWRYNMSEPVPIAIVVSIKRTQRGDEVTWFDHACRVRRYDVTYATLVVNLHHATDVIARG